MVACLWKRKLCAKARRTKILIYRLHGLTLVRRICACCRLLQQTTVPCAATLSILLNDDDKLAISSRWRIRTLSALTRRNAPCALVVIKLRASWPVIRVKTLTCTLFSNLIELFWFKTDWKKGRGIGHVLFERHNSLPTVRSALRNYLQITSTVAFLHGNYENVK